jgi:bacterial/archaeal transporter family-2 protein
VTPQVVTALAALVAAGAVLAVQAPVNAVLSRGAGDPVVAAAVNFGVGFLFCLTICVLRGVGPQAGMVAMVPTWAWFGGVLGGTYIATLIFAVPITGALTAAVATVLGQLVMALVLDRVGAFGMPVQEITWQRIAGVGLVFAGLLLTRA